MHELCEGCFARFRSHPGDEVGQNPYMDAVRDRVERGRPDAVIGRDADHIGTEHSRGSEERADGLTASVSPSNIE